MLGDDMVPVTLKFMAAPSAREALAAKLVSSLSLSDDHVECWPVPSLKEFIRNASRCSFFGEWASCFVLSEFTKSHASGAHRRYRSGRPRRGRAAADQSPPHHTSG